MTDALPPSAQSSPLAAPEHKKPVQWNPFSSFEWWIAFRYLRARRKETVISVIAILSFLGIMLGVATLIVVLSVMNGFRAQLLDKILGIDGHIILQPLDGRLTNYTDIADTISMINGVTLAAPVVEGQVLASGPRVGNGALVRGVRESDLKKIGSVEAGIQSGSLDGFDDTDAVAIGSRMAFSLGVAVGDTITLVSPRGAVTPFGVTPRVKAYPVAAIFEIGMSQYDGSVVFMPLAEAQLYFNHDERVSSIDIYTKEPDDIEAIRQQVRDTLNRPMHITDWRTRNTVFFSALQVERNLMFIILTMIVLVAALNIISGLVMLVKEKGGDIAVLRTIGATRGSILRIFLIAGSSIGFIGTFAGLILGLIICANVESIRQFVSYLTQTELFSPELYYLSKLPSEVNFWEATSILTMALTLSFLATLYPAWRASKLDPIEALRYE